MAKFLDGTGVTKLVSLIKQALYGKQETLVSGVNIKTINNGSLLGNGDITVVPYKSYIDEDTLLSDVTQPNGTIGYEAETHKFFIYCSPLEQWIMFAQGRRGFPYSFNITF